MTDPVGDGNGPGNYAYPTASDFHPGAYDMTDFQVYDTGTTVMFRVQTGDLTPTFGSPLGGQLIDVYVHEPAASATSSAAAFTQAQLHDRGGRAWSRMLEVQGFGQKFVDASGASSGTITISANQISRYITFSLTKAALGGTPSSGWGFTVTLTGQDGYSADSARAFTSTPGGYSFGVCATASAEAHCTFDAGSVPKVMDTLTSSGTDQSNELDYALHNPAVLAPVLMP